MESTTRWPRDPLDKPAPDNSGERLAGPLQTAPPRVDPGEADREKLLKGAKPFAKRPDKGLPPD